MARNDGIDRTSVRNLAVSDKAVGNTQQHNEREKDSYRNPDIIPQRAAWNVHFKKPTASYTDLFAQLEADGTISTRGLKPDATHYCELVFDVNSAYFDNHGGYEFAKQFYEDAYKAAVQIVGGEQYILSAVMHADEINRAMTEALGREVYHYHLHVVYVPVVEKQILWSKRCKDKALVGTVKETVMQVSRSKKWASKPLLDDAGKPVLQKSGKPVLKKSYSVLQDDFFNYMRNAGYTEVVTQTNAVKSPTDSPATTKLVYTVEEIARMLAISLRSAYNLCNSTTEFRVLRVGGSIRVPKDSFDAWLYRAA